LLRSPGAYFTKEDNPAGLTLCHAKLISNRGAWLEFDTKYCRRNVSENQRQEKDCHYYLATGARVNTNQLTTMFAKEDNSPNHSLY